MGFRGGLLQRLLGMAKPCRNVTGTATNSHLEREAILPSEKREYSSANTVLPLIQKEQGNGRDIVGKISMPDFYIIYPIVKSTYEVLVQFAFTSSLEMKLLWLSKWCPIGVNLVSMDRGHIGLHYDRRDLNVNGQFLSYSSVCSMVQLCQNIILI
ncbi:hypothetical protein YC2023_041122 [Brassica napus]